AEPGRWHTVVDAAETYLEPSVSAFVSLGVAQGVAQQRLPAAMLALAERALAATVSGIDAAGRFVDVSDATPVGSDKQHYTRRARGVYAWGQGPALLALVRSAELELV